MEPQAAATPQATNNQSADNGGWPGGFGLFKTAKNAYMVNLGPNLTILVLSIVFGLVLPRISKNAGTLVADLISVVLSAASVVLYLAGARGKKLSLGQAFPKDFMVYAKYIGLSILIGLTDIASLLLLIIPFFFVAPRLSLATYYLIDKDMGVMEAYKASWHATKGHVGKVYGIVGVSIVFAILCLVLVGIYLSIVYSTAYALLYLYIAGKGSAGPNPTMAAPQPTPADQPAVPQPPVSSAPQNQQPQPPVTPNAPPQV